MDKEQRKNYTIPRLSGEHTSKNERNWVLLNHKDDKWYWVALDTTMEARVITAANFIEAFEAVQMEITDKLS